MKTNLRSKRVLIPAVATVAVLAVGGGLWAASADDGVDGVQRDRVAAAAVEAAGGGQATEVETSDDRGEAYEVEVRKGDGSEVDVTLDKDLAVVKKHDDANADHDEAEDRDDVNDDRDADERALSAAERSSASKAALAAVGGGTVVKVEAGDGPEAYEVEVRDAKGAEWDVDLDRGFAVIAKDVDR